ncbi:GTP-binding protein [Streptomyces sp. S.PB5]|uniref:CobW family GTP-binding protein n=1 Tax=Streptomyces sp. S.PB5 TaxID=3020844 RepID=UPI00339D4F75
MTTTEAPATNAPRDEQVPVTVLTGFLGSGKTTLLNRILTEHHGMRIAVIENEFGEIGIDDTLVLDAEEEILEMNNGCICCTVRGDPSASWADATPREVRASPRQRRQPAHPGIRPVKTPIRRPPPPPALTDDHAAAIASRPPSPGKIRFC